MFDTGETLEYIEKWAEATFPHEFKAVKDYLRDNDITSKYRGPKDVKYRNLKTGDPHMLDYWVHVGCSGEGPFDDFSGEGPFDDLVFAHVTSGEGNHSHDIDFMEPFCWLNSDVNSVGFARFKELIMFICLSSAMSAEASIDVPQFKKHFEGACRVIAGRLEEQTRQKGPAAAPATFPTPSAGPSLTSELLPATQNQKKPDDMEEFLASQKASIEEFVETSRAADRQEKDRLLAETNELKQKLTKAEQECKESRNELDASREKFKRNAQKSKRELQEVKAEVKRLTGEVETFKKEAEKSTQEAKKAKRSLEDFQELEEVFERVQKRRIV
ncbi:hypothetical protein G6514_002128 [Epicoccum nigrum]|nr:hypothetical protein G6514_002128 [Epicoccum nigrum]